MHTNVCELLEYMYITIVFSVRTLYINVVFAIIILLCTWWRGGGRGHHSRLNPARHDITPTLLLRAVPGWALIAKRGSESQERAGTDGILAGKAELSTTSHRCVTTEGTPHLGAA